MEIASPQKPTTQIFSPVKTVGDLIKQLQDLDPTTPFADWQRIMHMKNEGYECVLFTQMNEVR